MLLRGFLVRKDALDKFDKRYNLDVQVAWCEQETSRTKHLYLRGVRLRKHDRKGPEKYHLRINASSTTFPAGAARLPNVQKAGFLPGPVLLERWSRGTGKSWFPTSKGVLEHAANFMR